MELCRLHDIAKPRIASRDGGDVACQPVQDGVQGWVKGRHIRLRRRWRGIRINTIGFRGDGDIARRRFGRDPRRLRLKPMNPSARGLAARQHRPGRPAAAEPGDVDGGIVAGGLARRQFAPDFDRGLGFLDVLEKCAFAEVAAPAAGFEQFAEVFQPLLGKSAPTRDNIAAACHVCSMSHESARKEKNGRGRNGDESMDVTEIFCGKLFILSSDQPCPASALADRPAQKRTTRPGGQPDGSSHTGAWDGWALAPDTASMGRDYRSHIYCVAEGSPNVQTTRDFFWPVSLDE